MKQGAILPTFYEHLFCTFALLGSLRVKASNKHVDKIDYRWASEDVESSILIGPSENAKTSSKIFGAWFDEGRITEMADSTTIWRTLGSKSSFLVSTKNKVHTKCFTDLG